MSVDLGLGLGQEVLYEFRKLVVNDLPFSIDGSESWNVTHRLDLALSGVFPCLLDFIEEVVGLIVLCLGSNLMSTPSCGFGLILLGVSVLVDSFFVKKSTRSLTPTTRRRIGSVPSILSMVMGVATSPKRPWCGS